MSKYLQIDGLPSGYEGRLIIVGYAEEPHWIAEPRECVYPGPGRKGEKVDALFAFIWPVGERFDLCGRFEFAVHSREEIVCEAANVWEVHQKRGIATSTYRFVEKVTGVLLTRNDVLTEEGEALWRSIDRQRSKS